MKLYKSVSGNLRYSAVLPCVTSTFFIAVNITYFLGSLYMQNKIMFQLVLEMLVNRKKLPIYTVVLNINTL